VASHPNSCRSPNLKYQECECGDKLFKEVIMKNKVSKMNPIRKRNVGIPTMHMYKKGPFEAQREVSHLLSKE
jgi:hypothetical protein